MLFTSPAFALFLPIMLAGYWSTRGSMRRAILLAGSYFFYGCWDWRFLGLLWISTFVDFWAAQRIERSAEPGHRRLWLILSLVTNLGILGTFKYLGFFTASFASMMAQFGIVVGGPALDILLPMGISFYTFQTMSYTIDVYRGERAERSWMTFALYVACFPQLVAGPIMRASVLLPQLATDRRADDIRLTDGAFRLLQGLIKKLILADSLALYVDMVFADPTGYTGISAWIALYAYAFQIFLDFSGYTDMAIGIGHLLGLRFMENFDRPYIARSPSEFWRRWHISLSTWLRDYLYIPLGGSRGSKWLTSRNLMITMALGGLWHGAAWTFVLWGLFHGLLLCAERAWKHVRGEIPSSSGAVRVVQVILMFHVTCLGWLLFRSESVGQVGQMLSNLTDFSPARIHGLRILAIVMVCAVLHLMPWRRLLDFLDQRVPAVGQGAIAAMGLWCVLLFSPNARPFIYFQF
ncbi:MAG: MBOAT family O-acyltransferase [Phycisphaerae bacterium]